MKIASGYSFSFRIDNLVPRVSLSPPPRAKGVGERETLGTRLQN